MKRVFTGILTAALAVLLCAATAFVDADGDGICDNCGARHGHWAGCGGGFVDADGDGVCDSFQSDQGRSCGYGRGGQGVRGSGFRGGQNR